jgi:phage terminase large subunit GpA-like protein
MSSAGQSPNFGCRSPNSGGQNCTPNYTGFRLNRLVSLLHNARWGVLAAEFLRAKDNPETLMPFVNTVLAQGWRAAGEDLDDAALADRVEPFSLDAIPPEVLVITCGVDCQDDRLECTFVGWSRVPGECFVLGHICIYGPITSDRRGRRQPCRADEPGGTGALASRRACHRLV